MVWVVVMGVVVWGGIVVWAIAMGKTAAKHAPPPPQDREGW